MMYLGIDIGGMSIKCAFVTPDGEIKHKFVLKVVPETQTKTLKRLGDAINQNITEQGFTKEDFVGIGIGCPGSINNVTGVCEFSGNLNWKKAPLKNTIQEITGLPVKVTNDANAAMLGEAKFGVGKDYSDLVLLTLGTGVGGGLFLNGKLYEGKEGKGAELGHVVIEKGGRQCTCGLKGCFEAYASVTALIKNTKEAMLNDKSSFMWECVDGDLEKVSGRTCFEAAERGDKTAIKVIDEYEDDLTLGIANFCNIFRPEAVILGGGLSNQGKTLSDEIEKKLKKLHYGFKGTPAVKILISELKNEAGLLGAAALWLD